MTTIANNLQQVLAAIARACAAAGRDPAGVRLLAVSKTFGADAVQQAVAAGQRDFGENYVQEGVDKIAAVRAALPDVVLQWHCIGPLQSNKTRPVAEHFDWVHTVDRLKIAERLSAQRPANLPPLQVCIQVNISGEASKSGAEPGDVPALARAVAALPRLRLRGLMAIPEPEGELERQRDHEHDRPAHTRTGKSRTNRRVGRRSAEVEHLEKRGHQVLHILIEDADAGPHEGQARDEEQLDQDQERDPGERRQQRSADPYDQVDEEDQDRQEQVDQVRQDQG